MQSGNPETNTCYIPQNINTSIRSKNLMVYFWVMVGIFITGIILGIVDIIIPHDSLVIASWFLLCVPVVGIILIINYLPQWSKFDYKP